jgi:hypothetical protein
MCTPFAFWSLLIACSSPEGDGSHPAPDVALNEISPSNHLVLQDAAGGTPDWIELLNTTDVAADLTGWTLSDDEAVPAKWTFPQATIAPGGFLLVFASGDGISTPDELHASFELDSAGERVTLYDRSGTAVDTVEPAAMDADQSYGRRLDDDSWAYFLAPTPGASNTTESRPGFAAPPTIDPPGGFYPGTVNVKFVAKAGDDVHYTQDANDPAEGDPVAPPGGVSVAGGDSDAVVVRARAFSDELWPSPVVTSTYLFRDPGAMPIVSVVTAPANLWDDETGIYAFGNDYDPEVPYLGANFWQDWEVPAHAEEWEPNGVRGFSVDADLSIHGGWTRAFEQKSLDLKIEGDIEQQIFPDLGITSFDRILLRNAGNDWHGCFADGCSTGAHLRDGAVQAIAAGQDVDTMAYRPTELYLDGAWWGIYELREKPDKSYVKAHYDQGDIDLLELGIPLEGDADSWNETMDFLRTHDLSDPTNWAAVEDAIDVDELATWLAIELFADNTDWPGNNVRWWRPRAEGGKWRWFLYDVDYGLGAYAASPDHDTLAFALETDGPQWPNPPWATELFRLMMSSDPFVQLFVSRYADLLNTSFASTNTLATVSGVVAGIAPLMPRQVDRWGVWSDGASTYTMPDGTWEASVQAMDDWLELRPAFVRQHLVDDLGLAGTYTLDLATDPPGAGTFQLTSAEVDGNWEGIYFQGVPVTVTAVPTDGHTFLGWADPSLGTSPTAVVDSSGENVALVARFQ